jgi:actin-related protein
MIVNPKDIREKTALLLFEDFKVPAMCLANHSVLALCAIGRTTGAVLEVGHDSAQAVPVYEGNCLPQCVINSPLGGIDITDYLMKLLTDSGYSFTTAQERALVRDIKEKTCFINTNMQKVQDSEVYARYQLPDDQELIMHTECFGAPEALFQPKFLGLSCPGVHDALYNSITKCENDIRQGMFSNIVLSGGSSRFNGFKERLTKEINQIGTSSMEVNVTVSNGQDSVWIGGSIYSSLASFQNLLITRASFEEYGATIINRKL